MYEVILETFSGLRTNSIIVSDCIDVVLEEIKKLKNDFMIIKIVNKSKRNGLVDKQDGVTANAEATNIGN